MATVLFDTSVASFFHPGREALAYRRLYERDLAGNVLAVSFQTVAELAAGLVPVAPAPLIHCRHAEEEARTRSRHPQADR
jgi:hypothetical protein